MWSRTCTPSLVSESIDVLFDDSSRISMNIYVVLSAVNENVHLLYSVGHDVQSSERRDAVGDIFFWKRYSIVSYFYSACI